MGESGSNRQWIYARRPEGALAASDFELREAPLPLPGPGQALARVRMVSVDPAQRAWMMGPTYRPQLQPGEVMPAFALAEVQASNAPGLKAGDIVEGDFGWQDYALVSPGAARRRDRSQSLEHLMGVLGITGLTAYFGLFEVGRPRPGETVLISAAAGAVGSIAVQLARIAGCRVVGIAGGAEKCRRLKETLGADAAVDYKAGGLREALKAACPEGIDVYFDNTGGEILDTAMSLMNLRGRIACCGSVSQYDQAGWAGGARGVPGLVIAKRLRMEGFIVMDFDAQRRAAETALLAWIASGRLVVPVDVRDGLGLAPQALVDLLQGRNFGKLMVRVG